MQPPRPADLEGRLIANSVHARLFPGDERPTRIGNYVIIRRIGGGAMGDVFLAHHESLDRQAAIKLVRPAAEDSTIERQRLLREATILAKIDHPHVIGVHDSGTHDNRVYLAMEYVKGTTLGVWQKGRPWRELLAVYLKAGRGLQAVHAVVLDADERNATGTTRRCLCHRDFKPDNVLISDHGDVRVADFGLAVPTQRREPGQGGRAIDLRLTADASVVGTPLYISPEQLGGSPGDARSDQYSFCVALYEALYDQHPYYAPAPAVRDSELATDSGGPGGTHPQFALFEAILGAPLRPAPRSKVPRRIHTILARGLQRDPAARYPSMAALLAALEHDPMRRPLQAFAGIAVIGTAFGIGLSLATAIPEMCSNIEQETANLWNDARREEVKAAFARTGASYADSSFAAVDTSITNYLTRWTATRQAACDATYRDSTELPEMQQRSMACLAQQLDGARNLLVDLGTVDTRTIASARDRVDALADPASCDARHLYARGCNLESPTDPAVARVRPRIQAAMDAEIEGRFLEAEALAANAVVAARAEDIPSLIVDAQFTHGRILTELGRPELARDALLAARDAAEAARCDTATIDIDAYTAKLVALNPKLDAGFGEHAIHTGLARLARSGQEDPAREAQLRNDSGLLHEYRLENFAAAEQDYLAALDLRTQHGLAHTTAQARTKQNLGTFLRRQERYPEAITTLTDALALYSATYGEDHPALWKPLFNLGLTQYDADQLPEAESTLTRALTLAKEMLGEDSADVRDVYSTLANVAIDRGNGPQAQLYTSAGLMACGVSLSDLPIACFDLRRQLAHARYLQGEHLEALDRRLQILNDLRARSDETNLADHHIDLAASFIALQRWQEALTQAKLAEAELHRSDSDRHVPELALYMGEALVALHRPKEAVAAFERAQVLSDNAPGLRAKATWGLAQSWCAIGTEPDLTEDLARDARAYFDRDRIDPETADLIKKIDELLRSGCLSKPQK